MVAAACVAAVLCAFTSCVVCFAMRYTVLLRYSLGTSRYLDKALFLILLCYGVVVAVVVCIWSISMCIGVF